MNILVLYRLSDSYREAPRDVVDGKTGEEGAADVRQAVGLSSFNQAAPSEDTDKPAACRTVTVTCGLSRQVSESHKFVTVQRIFQFSQ